MAQSVAALATLKLCRPSITSLANLAQGADLQFSCPNKRKQILAGRDTELADLVNFKVSKERFLEHVPIFGRH